MEAQGSASSSTSLNANRQMNSQQQMYETLKCQQEVTREGKYSCLGSG